MITDPVFYALAVPAVITMGLAKGGFAGVGQLAMPRTSPSYLLMCSLRSAIFVMRSIVTTKHCVNGVS